MTDNSTEQSTDQKSIQELANYPDSYSENDETVFRAENINIYYGDFLAVRDVNMEIPARKVTAFIGPSGCGKSTLIRCLNRLNDLIEGFCLEGRMFYHDQNLYADEVDPVEVRRRIGMVFQQPNPFPKSIYNNVAYGIRVTGKKDADMDEVVERSLQRAALWDEVKDKLGANGLSLSGGQQQRLCIARAIATNPDVVLMDEPCSSLDPISTLKIEELIRDLSEEYTIVIVTHNMQQATRVSDITAFFNAQANEEGKRSGYLVEYGPTEHIFNSPQQEATQNYVSGQFG
ncbi:MAG: phosphate ABC transporter ATP-binding protein [Leptolyngbyaceae cyanobacterium SM1_1_3]|nr:phosphate ABC transporter ATP-binding protein [Leptolyngbyaceae cyanobacterium SM1_1_3]NJN04969.1 phosphate ABC transporter ATP-binding protein [Leptolyngbyaceae cyanobacterium RM1_1_2]NJO10162.1 phosphate ABC transporter ATP-binding protein [Leptolyngbyaceae cyanobacterium SL_1_1]